MLSFPREFYKLSFDKCSQEATLMGLTSVNGERFRSLVYKIHRDAVRLDMGHNFLGDRATSEVQAALECLNDKIKFITLRGNLLGKKSGKDMSLICSSFKHVTHLELSFNDLCSTDPHMQSDLAIGLGGLASTPIVWLSLDSNRLGYLGDELLISTIASLTSLKSLNISYNNLNLKSEGILESMCSSVPSNLEHLDISNNHLGSKIKVIKKLPGNINSLNISDNAINQLSVEEIKELRDSLTHLQILYISYDEFKMMSSKQKNALNPILAAINKVIFLDSSGKEVSLEPLSLSTNSLVFFVRSNDRKEQIVESSNSNQLRK